MLCWPGCRLRCIRAQVLQNLLANRFKLAVNGETRAMKVESGIGSVEMIVVDHVEKSPTEN